MIGKGIVKGKGLGSYTSIPKGLITPIQVDGLGTTRSFYLTINSKEMYYRTTGIGSAPDVAIQQSSSDLQLYEGESVHEFPFPMDGNGAYMGPHQFLGNIYYDTLPCKPFSDYGVLYSLPCPIIPTIRQVYFDIKTRIICLSFILAPYSRKHVTLVPHQRQLHPPHCLQPYHFRHPYHPPTTLRLK